MFNDLTYSTFSSHCLLILYNLQQVLVYGQNTADDFKVAVYIGCID